MPVKKVHPDTITISIHTTERAGMYTIVPVIDLMNIILAFDHSSTTIFAPDGYVSDVEHLRACFLIGYMITLNT